MKGRSLFARRSTLDTLARRVSETRKRINSTLDQMEGTIASRRTAAEANGSKRRWLWGAVPAAIAGAAGVAWYAYGKKEKTGSTWSKMRASMRRD